MKKPYDWMPEARQIAAQCWCDSETQHLVMEPALCEAFAKRLAAWMQTGAQHAKNEAYWRDRARVVPDLLSALNAMLTHFGMDEDEWTKPTFNQARAAIKKAEGA